MTFEAVYNDACILLLMQIEGVYNDATKQESRIGKRVEIERGPQVSICLLYTSPSPRDRQKSRMPSSA